MQGLWVNSVSYGEQRNQIKSRPLITKTSQRRNRLDKNGFVTISLHRIQRQLRAGFCHSFSTGLTEWTGLEKKHPANPVPPVKNYFSLRLNSAQE